MARISGKAGNCYVADLLLEDCEDAWESGTHGTASLESTIVKVGSGSSKCVLGVGITNADIVMFETMGAAKNVSTYTHILCWARATADVAANDLVIGLGTTASGGSPTSQVNIPALSADTWKYCHCAEVAGKTLDDTTAGTIIGLEMNANAQEMSVYLDDIRAAKNIAGIRSWTLDQIYDVSEVTGFDSSGHRAYIPVLTGWSGSFEGFKDGAPLTIGTQMGIELAESATVTQAFLGNCIITGLHPATPTDGVVTYSYDFQGVGVLTIATT